MIRRPPRSTLFPLHDALPILKRCSSCTRRETPWSASRMPRRFFWPPNKSSRRSEEHTSELQSRSDLVCRLLLEKKKTLGAHCRGCEELDCLSRTRILDYLRQC